MKRACLGIVCPIPRAFGIGIPAKTCIALDSYVITPAIYYYNGNPIYGLRFTV
jgi:hypothetical protein